MNAESVTMEMAQAQESKRLSGAARKRENWKRIAELTEQRKADRRSGKSWEKPEKVARGKRSLKPIKVWS